MHVPAPFLLAALGLTVLSAASTLAATKSPPQAAQKDPPAASATPVELGKTQDWAAWSFAEKGAKVCYLLGHPAKSQPAKLNRGRIDAIITHRPGEKAVNVVNFDVGYTFKEGTDAELDIDGKKFTLFTEKDAAWARDAATDKAVVEALAKGKQATLKGTSAHGTVTTDTYKLTGFSEILSAIDKACGIKR